MSTRAGPGPDESRPSLRTRARLCWQPVADYCANHWRAIRPGPEARRGAVGGTLAAAAACVVIAGLYLRTGFGYAFDFAFAILFAGVLIPFVAVSVALLLTIVGKLPRLATGWILGSCVIVMLEWFPPHVGIAMAIVVGLAEGVLGATIATFAVGHFAQATLSKKLITVLLFLLAVTANVFFLWFLGRDGSVETVLAWRPPADLMPAQLSTPNPSQKGPHSVNRLFYGAGTDIRRPEYGSSVRIQTHTVDASEFFKGLKGWKRWTSERYWGFGADQLPLNARVWYPDGPGPFPLALIVHGNHNMADFSDPGYAYLGELLASHGFILASVDENFLNDSLFDDAPKPQAVRAWLLLEHLKLWRDWNQTTGNPFHHKVDLSHIALMGHSRGGEAAATAAAFNRMTFYPDDATIHFDYQFPIKAVVAIAPADDQYRPAGQHLWIEDVSYLTVQGAHDADVASFRGSRQWDHVRYTQPGPWFKAEIYAYRANHGQFNTVWGRTDTERPLSWLLNLKPLMPGEEQRRISKTYIAAFLEATLRERREYLPLFQDWRVARRWLPDTLYVNRYQDASYVPLASFDEDADITTTTAPGGHMAGENLSIWREGRIPWRHGDRDYNGVFLGWNRPQGAPVPTYAVTLPEGAAAKWQLGSHSTLELSIAALDLEAPLPGKRKDEKDKKQEKSKTRDRESPNFTLELVASDGAIASAPVTRFAVIPPPLKAKFTKLDVLDSYAYEKDWEPAFQTVRVPLMAFQSAGGSRRLDLRKLNMVRLKFDRTAMAVICVSGIGFGKQ
jgi:dienelactone hydrolase